MANYLTLAKSLLVWEALQEGHSTRHVARLTGAHQDTIRRFGKWLSTRTNPMKKKIIANQYRCKCNRCGYDWISRKGVPAVCANKHCHSPFWDRKVA